MSTVVLLAALSAAAQEPALPAGGQDLLPADPLPAMRLPNQPGLSRSEVVAVTGQPFSQAVRVAVLRRTAQAWDVQLALSVTGPIRTGDVLALAFWARGVQSDDEAGEVRFTGYAQQNTEPHTKLVTAAAVAGAEWRHVLGVERSRRDLPAGSANVVFHLGTVPQTVEIAGLRLVNYGPDAKTTDFPVTRVSYAGREPDAPWRAAAAARIARYRQADLVVKVVDAAGQPVPAAAVRVAMQRHRFGFGAAVTAQTLAAESPDGDRYRAVVAEHYNKVVFENDLKWGPWLAGQSNAHATYRQSWLETAFAWLLERRIEVRGHYLTWAPLERATAKYRGQPDQLRTDLRAHLEDKIPRVGRRVTEWDAINHIVGWGETFATTCGGNDIYADIMRWSRELAPDVAMWVNEGQVLPGGSRRDAYEAVIRDLIAAGAAPDGIGFMGHFGRASLTPPEALIPVFDRFAALVPQLQLTELDVDVADDEQLQADYLRDVMIQAFSHPAFTGIVMWGFWEGRHWKPAAALYRRDWSIKPAGQAWLDLVRRDWWTDVAGQTGADGAMSTRAFHGTHQVSVTANGRAGQATVDLGPAGAAVTVRLD